MSRSEKKRRNVLAVIEMFASVGLPVCDDEEAIRAKRDEQREARNRELNSTKGTIAARAQQWFEDVDALLNHREKLLTVVFEEFCGLADTALRAGLDGGRNELGSDTLIALRDMAMSWCRARSDLANFWIERFSEMRGLTAGEPVDGTDLVDDLRATARGGRVTLRWKMPEDDCDGVRIVRAPDPATSKADELIVYEGADTGFVDTNVESGAHYGYRIYALSNGRPSLRAAHVTTRKKAKERKLAMPFAAIALIGLAGALAWDWQRDGSWLATQVASARTAEVVAVASSDESEPQNHEAISDISDDRSLSESHDANTLDELSDAHFGIDLESAEQAPSDDVVAAEELAERLASGDHESLGVVGEEEVAPPPPIGPPPTALVLDAPSLAFSGQTLLIELEIDRPLEAALIEPTMRGVRLRGLELDRSPGVVRLYVDDLPEDKLEGEAVWSFRLADAQGLETASITGRCLVLRSADG